jgi:hypothetical protein
VTHRIRSPLHRLALAIALGTAALLALPIPTPGPTSAHAAESSLQPHTLASFELPDQFGTRHAFSFPRERPLLLLVGDRRGSEDIDAWVAPLKARWSHVADIHGIADVQAVPRFLKQRVTEAIRKSRPKPLLLDFEGSVTRQLPFERKAANVFVIDPTGRVLAHVHGAYTTTTNTNDDPRLVKLARALETAPATTTTPRPTPPNPKSDR